jgi:hypothetical protein
MSCGIARAGRDREVRSVLASEIGLLELDELCTHVLSGKLASGKVERYANDTIWNGVRWIARLIAVSSLLRGGGGWRLLLLLLLLWLLLLIV